MTAEPPLSGLRKPGAGHATVGMFERPAWGFGGERTFSPGEVVRVRQPIPSIVVQSIGGPLPAFAQARPFVDERPDFELDLIFDAPRLSSGLHDLARLGHITPGMRFVLCAAPLASGLGQAGALPPTDFLIAADASDVAALAEALALVLSGRLLICVDLADIRYCSGWTPGRCAHGRAVAISGLGDAAMADLLRGWFARQADDGFDGGVLLAQLICAEDADKLALAAFDAFCQNAVSAMGDRPAVMTMSIDASVTEVAAIVFASRR